MYLLISSLTEGDFCKYNRKVYTHAQLRVTRTRPHMYDTDWTRQLRKAKVATQRRGKAILDLF